MNYYVPIKSAFWGTKNYMYLDARDEYHADSLLRKHGVHARFRKGEWISPDGRYRLLYCSVPSREAQQFKTAISELPNRMLLLGYGDYCEVWVKLMNFIEENRRK